MKNMSAVELGRLGGRKRVANQTQEQRTKSARHAIAKRWQKVKERDAELCLQFGGIPSKALRSIRIRLRKHKMTIDDFKKHLAVQHDACALCERKIRFDRTLHFDHDHITGKFRGLLCVKCNTSLGGLGDSVKGLERALLYLKGALK